MQVARIPAVSPSIQSDRREAIFASWLSVTGQTTQRDLYDPLGAVYLRTNCNDSHEETSERWTLRLSL